MATRRFAILVELEAENEKDFEYTPFDTPGQFAQNLSALLYEQMDKAGVLGTYTVSMATVNASEVKK